MDLLCADSDGGHVEFDGLRQKTGLRDLRTFKRYSGARPRRFSCHYKCPTSMRSTLVMIRGTPMRGLLNRHGRGRNAPAMCVSRRETKIPRVVADRSQRSEAPERH